MAELLRLESTRLYGNNNPGCSCGVFHIFDSYQRREDKRIVSYGMLRGSQSDVGTDVFTANDGAGGEDDVADKGTNVVVGEKDIKKNTSSGKARMAKFIGKKLLRRQKHKGKMCHSSSSRMTRTLSIHHLEINDYVSPEEFGQLSSDSDTSTIAPILDDTDHSQAISEHDSELHELENHLVDDELNKQRETKTAENKNEHHRITMDRILDKVPSGQKLHLPEDLEDDNKSHRRDFEGFKFHRAAPASSISKSGEMSVRRSRSLNESLDMYSQLLCSISVDEARKTPERNSSRENNGLLNMKLPKTYGRMLSNPEFLRSYSAHFVFQSSKKPTLESGECALSPTATNAEEIACEQDESLDSIVEASISDEDANIEDSDVQQLDDNIEEQFPYHEALNEVAEPPTPAFDEEISSKFGGGDLVKENDWGRYNYVKQILGKCGYYEGLRLDTEEEESCIEEQRPIYDLIKEVLLEIYEEDFCWLPRFHCKKRGRYLLGQVWAEVRWHLSSPQEFCATVDNILARNFSKTDGWMNLYRDAECFALLLEQLILDDLVDEIILDSAQF